MIEPDINERMARFAPSQRGSFMQKIMEGAATPEQRDVEYPSMPDYTGAKIAEDVAAMGELSEPAAPVRPVQSSPIAEDIAEQARQNLNASLVGVRTVNPDEAAKAMRLGRQLDLPPEVVRADMRRAEEQEYLDRLRSRDILRNDPVLANYLANREFANIAHDDIDNLTAIERTFKFFRDIPSGVSEGFTKAVSQAEMADIIERQRQRGGYLEEYEKAALDSYSRELAALSVETGLAEAGSYLFSQQLTGWKQEDIDIILAGGVIGGGAGLVGGPLAPATVPAGMALGLKAGLSTALVNRSLRMERALLYAELEPELGNDLANQIATGAGVVNAALDVGALGIVTKPLREPFKAAFRQSVKEAVKKQTVRQAFGRFGLWYAGSAATEVGTETLQELNNVLGMELGLYLQDKPLVLTTEEGRAEVADRLANIAAETALGMVTVGLPGPAFQFYADVRRSAKATRDHKLLENITKTVAESKVLPRDAATMEQYLASTAAGTDAETTYIDAAVAHDILRQSGLTDLEMDAVLPGVRQQIEQYQSDGITLVGADVTIPTAQFAARLAKTPLQSQLLPHARLSADAPSLVEAQRIRAEHDQRRAEAEQIIAQQEATNSTFVQEAREIEDTAFEQIKALGQFTDIEARTIAKIRQAMVVVDAAEAGMTPAQYQRERGVPLVIRGEGMAAPMVPAVAVETTIGEAAANGIRAAVTPVSDQVQQAIDSKTLGERQGKQAKDSLRKIGKAIDSRNINEIANAVWQAAARNIPQLSRLVESVNQALASVGIEVVDPMGQNWVEGWNEVEAIAFEPYQEGQANEAPQVVRTMRPIVRRDGQIVQRGQVVVREGSPAYVAAQEQREAELRARMQGGEGPVLEQAATLDAETQSINEAATAVSDDVAKADSQPEIPQAIDNAAALDEVGRLATGQTWAKGRDLKQAMQNRVLSLAANAGVNLSLDTPQTTEYLTRIGYRDALYALRQNPNSVGWYDEKTRQAIAVMALVHPELLTDENARFAFTWALAVTSNGIKVDKNFELADSVYRTYKATGKMPTDLTAGQAQAAINRSLGMFNELRDAWGIDNLRRFAQTEYTIQELRYIVDDFDAGGEFAETTVKGAGIIGPKIGNGFFSNLYGDFRSLTMDRWLIRTWGRWTGTLIKAMPVQTQNARTRLGQAVGALNEETRTTIASILRDQIPESQELQREVIDALAAGESVDLDVLSTVIQKASMDKDARAALNESMAGQEIRKSGNSLAKYLDGQKEAPAGPGERVQIRAIFASILQELQKLPQYADLTMADLQAALWYAEKRLYETAKEDIQVDEESIEGYADDEAPDYANAASNVARASGVSEQRIQATLAKESNSERSRRARLQDEQGKPVEARDQGPARGFTAKEKRSFNGAAVIRNHRASRGGNAGQPWAYQRSGAKADAKPRLVKKLGARVIAKFNPDRRLRNALASAGGDLRPFSAPSFLELEPGERSAQAFHKLITESKQKNAYGASVYAYPVGDYASMRLFVSEDRQSGFALKPDGDIVSVFSMADSGAGHAIVQMAVSQGGRKLDAFETVLPYLYAPHGFRVVSRLRWDESQKPEGWDKQTFKDFNGGEPDVVFMVYDPTYYGQHSKKDGKVAKSYDAAVRAQTSEVEKIAQGGQFQQAMPAGGPRGGFDPRTLAVLINKGGDVTTLFHELIHLRIAEYMRVAQMPGAPARVSQDLDILFNFMGVEGDTFEQRLANYQSMPVDARRPLEEKVTYNAEIYVYEGKAPSAELQGVFERMAAWMRRVYKSIRDDLNAIYRREFGTDLPILTSEVRAVFDRMLASEEAIKRQAAINEMKPMFQTREEAMAFGMPEAEWAAFQQMQQEAIEASVIDMNVASMRQMQWLGNARSRVLREVQKKHDARRKEVAVEIAAEVKVEPVYRAMTYLRTGKFVDADGAEVAVEGPHRLDTKRVKKLYETVPTAASLEAVRATGMPLPAVIAPDIAKLGTGKNGMMGLDGLDPDLVAETFGYSSGDEMIRALVAARPMKEIVAERTDAEMLRRFGDMNTPEAVEAEVQAALHNEARARMVAVQLRFVSKATEPARVMVDAAKQVARDLIAAKRVRDVRPSDFVAAEARAARDSEYLVKYEAQPKIAGRAEYDRVYNLALSAGSTEEGAITAATAAQEAFVATQRALRAEEFRARFGPTTPQEALIRAQRAQLYQNQLAAEALRVKAEVDKQVKYLRRVLRDENVKRMGADATDQVRAILDNYSLVSMTRAQREQVTDLRNWLAAEEANGTLVDIDPSLADSARRKNYTELTVEQFRDLVDSVKQIEYRGKNERNIYLAGQKLVFEEMRDGVVASMTEVAEKKGRKVRKDLGDEDRKWMNTIASYDASQQTIANIVYVLDGGKRDGPLARALIMPANDAGNQEAADRAAVSEKVNDIVGPLAKKGQFAAPKMHFPHIGESLSLEQRMVIALNYGNQSNIDRLLNGEQWTADQARVIIESLTEEQLQAVQAIWDVMSSFRDRVAEKSRRLTGKEPRWLEPLPMSVTSADGRTVELRGGYYPAKYNPRRSVGARKTEVLEDADRLQREAYTATTTSRSFEKNRSDKPPVDQVLSRQFVAMYSGLNEVIHDLAWHDFAISANRLLRDKQFEGLIKQRYGAETYNAIKDWVDVVVAGDRTKYDAFEQVAIFARQNVSVSAMGIRLMTAAVQPTGIFPAMTRVGIGPMVRAIAEFAYSPVQTSRNVLSRSSFMQSRGRTRFRDLNEIQNIVQEQSRFQRVRRTYIASAYVLTSFTQGLVDTSVWMAAYSNAIKAGKSEKDAVFVADQTVIDTQGSGRVQDLSSAMRGGKKQSAYAKLFTPFYQYSNTMYSLFGAQMRTAPTYGKAAKDALLILTVGAIVEELIRYALKPSQEEPEPEELAKKLAANQIDFVVGLPFGLREFRGAGSLIMGTEDGVQSYRGPSGLRIVTDATQAAVQARQGEFDAAFRRAVINLLGTTAGIPSAQINDTINGIEAVMEGEVEGAEAVLAPVTGVRR